MNKFNGNTGNIIKESIISINDNNEVIFAGKYKDALIKLIREEIYKTQIEDIINE